jgi:hypothetical protein
MKKYEKKHVVTFAYYIHTLVKIVFFFFFLPHLLAYSSSSIRLDLDMWIYVTSMKRWNENVVQSMEHLISDSISTIYQDGFVFHPIRSINFHSEIHDNV